VYVMARQVSEILRVNFAVAGDSINIATNVVIVALALIMVRRYVQHAGPPVALDGGWPAGRTMQFHAEISSCKSTEEV
jgi:hypothetical protein